MSRKMNEGKPRAARREFLKSAGAAAGLYLAGAGDRAGAQTPEGPAQKETLALHGGPKAVTAPQDDVTRWPRFGAAEEQAVLELVRRPSYAPNSALEKDWQAIYKVPYVKSYCNGTSALLTMFFALNLPPGSEIMVPSYTFFATIVPMRLFGLVPVFVDINPRTLNFDLDDAKRRLTKDTKAVLPVHWIGLPADMDQICDWAKEKGLIVLEDACHAHGASLRGKLMGTWGEMAAFSFQESKPLPGIEGGMAHYQSREHYERGASFGHYELGRALPNDSPWRRYYWSGIALKLRMHPLAAVLVRSQLRGLAERNAAGVAQVRRLNERILHLPGLYEQSSGRTDMQRIHYEWNMLFIDEAEAGMSRDACVKALQREGVRAAADNYPLQHTFPLYREPQWWHHPPVIPELPGCQQAHKTGIALPYFKAEAPELVDQYAKAFEKVWAHRRELG